MMLKIIFVILKVMLISWAYAKIAKIDNENRLLYNANQLTPPRYEKIVGFLATIFFGFCTFIIMITPTSVNKTATWQVAVVFGLFTLFSLATLWHYAICRHSYDDNGLTYINFFNKKKFLAWQDIDSIQYSYIWKCGILISNTGEKFYISDNMVGLNDFIQMLDDKAPDDE